MTQFRTRRDGQRFPLQGGKGGPVVDANEMARQKQGFNERVIEESKKIEIKAPQNAPSKRGHCSTGKRS